MTRNALSIATSIFAIQDVFLVASKVTVDRAHNPLEPLTASVQIRHSVEPSGVMQTRTTLDGDQEVLIMRRYVDTGLRILGLETPDQPEQQKTIAELEATFAADYIVTTGEKPESDVISAFDENIVFHVWPYWREYVQNSLSRLRLPPIILPMFKRHYARQQSQEGGAETSATPEPSVQNT